MSVAAKERKIPKETLDLKTETATDDAGVIALVSKVFDVPGERIRAGSLSGGVTNRLYRCTLDPDTDGRLHVLVRVYGLGTDVIVDRSRELATIAELRAVGEGPMVYAVFGNGMVYEYFDGTVQEPDSVKVEETKGDVGRKLARWHALNIDVPSTLTAAAAAAPAAAAPRFFEMLDRFFEHALRVDEAAGLDDARRERLRAIDLDGRVAREVEFVRAFVDAGAAGPSVFCHNDILPGNVIRRPSGALTFIDYEYACFNARGFDLGNHFCEYAGFDCDYDANFPDLGAMRPVLEAYLRGSSSDGGDVRDADVATLAREAFHGALMSHFFWGVWALVQLKSSDIDFDYLEYAELRFAAYFSWKERGAANVVKGL